MRPRTGNKGPSLLVDVLHFRNNPRIVRQLLAEHLKSTDPPIVANEEYRVLSPAHNILHDKANAVAATMYGSRRIATKNHATCSGMNTEICIELPSFIYQAWEKQSHPLPSQQDAESSGFTLNKRHFHGKQVRVSISASCDINQVDAQGAQLLPTLVGSIIETMLGCAENYKPFAREAVFKAMHPKEVVPNPFRPDYAPLRLDQPDIVLARDVIPAGSLNVDFTNLWYDVALDFKTGAVYTSIHHGRVPEVRHDYTRTLCMI